MPEVHGMTAELVGDRELQLTRFFRAPRSLVWQAWTDPDHFAQWWGPHTFTTTIREMDVRPGGICHYLMHSEQYGGSWGKFTYLEVEAPERLVVLEAFSDEEGNTAGGLPPCTITVSLAEEDGGTLVTMDLVYESSEVRAQYLEFGMQQGMAETFERLATLVEA